MDQTTGTDKADDGVAPGDVFRYVWHVRASFAPTPDDEACLPWAYHSHVSPTKDVDSGLVGLLLTCKRGREAVAVTVGFDLIALLLLHGANCAFRGSRYPTYFC